MSTLLQYGRDIQGYSSSSSSFSTDFYSAVLQQNTALSLTIPSSNNTWMMEVIVEPTKNVWVGLDGSPVVPSTGTMSAANCQMICPYETYRKVVYANDVVSFLTTDTSCKLSIALYAMSY